jgi:hypothetical protein
MITCRRCEKTGHLGADCPEKPKFTCRNCDAEGHGAKDCPVSSPFPNYTPPTSLPFPRVLRRVFAGAFVPCLGDGG